MELYQRVRLITNKFEDEGVKIGDVGYIIEIYNGRNYEVEFSDSKTGFTIAQIVVDETEVELVD